MKPTKIDHKKKIIWKGYESKDPSIGRIEDLEAVRVADGAITSAWKPSWREWWAMLFGAPVWVGVITQQLPPVRIYAAHDGQLGPED